MNNRCKTYKIEDIPDISKYEIRLVIKKMKFNKAPWEDDIVAKNTQ